ncbi:MAG TPA: DUF3515 family protein [Pseudolysinimonas sp.]|nr:DUF3515 family protein [Pseudolysinimonas sp.]
MKRRWAAAAAGVSLALMLAGCTPAVVLDPADDANNPDCAAVIVRLPDTVGGLAQRETTAQATGAWGDPDQVVLRCGVAVPTASELPCIDKGVFWLRDDSDPKFWRFTTFGRDPAIDVAVDKNIASGPGVVLDDLANAVSFTPTNGLTCTDTDQTVTGE